MKPIENAAGRKWRKNVKRPDDLPRIVTGFVVGLVLAFVLSAGFGMLLSLFFDRFRVMQGVCQAIFSTSLIVLVSTAPIVGAAALARHNRVSVAQKTLAYGLSVFALFAVVCGGPVGVPLLVVFVLIGVGGLTGVVGVALAEELWSGRQSPALPPVQREVSSHQ